MEESQAGSPDQSHTISLAIERRSVAVSSPCATHQWSHATESCPYCREINPDTRAPRDASAI